jgi:hypothetical protein
MNSTVTTNKTTTITETIVTTTVPSGTTTPVTTTPVTTTPVTTNPGTILAMPAGITNGAPVTIGTGPNSIQLNMGNNLPGNLPPNTPDCVFAVLVDGVAVAGPLTVSGVGSGGTTGQVFTINGNWGAGPHTISIDGVGTGIYGLFVNSVDYDFVAYQTGGATAIFANGNNSTWSPVGVPVINTPPPAPSLSTITGATIGGTVVAANTLQPIVSDMVAGSILGLPAGTIVGTATINAAGTIDGAGAGKTIIDCTNLTPYQNKAVLVTSVPGVTINGLTIRGAAIAANLGANAAGVRDTGPGIGFTLSASEITACQDGLLTSASNITVNNCNIHGNGAGLVGGSATHELYIGGGPATIFSMTGTTVATGPLATHAVKSRAGKTSVVGGTLTAGAADSGAVSGSIADIPDGGNATFSGVAFVLRPSAAVTLFLGYGMESASNLAAGVTVMLTNCTFNGGGVAGEIQNGTFIPSAKLVLSGCTYTGTAGPPAISGFASVTGTIALAA